MGARSPCVRGIEDECVCLPSDPLKKAVKIRYKKSARIILCVRPALRGPGIAHWSGTDNMQKPHAEYDKYTNVGAHAPTSVVFAYPHGVYRCLILDSN